MAEPLPLPVDVAPPEPDTVAFWTPPIEVAVTAGVAADEDEEEAAEEELEAAVGEVPSEQAADCGTWTP